MNRMYLIFLIIHLLISLVMYTLIKFSIVKVHKYLIFVILFIPFWGALFTIAVHFQITLKATNNKKIGIEKMTLESDKYSEIVSSDNGKNSDTIPLEEALVINSPKERRKIIMDVLSDNPKEYVEFLKKAGDNEDSEVVHYAVTAMVEISKENDYKLQSFEKEYSRNKGDYKLLRDYCDFLWKYIELNLAEGQAEKTNRYLFMSLILKKISINPKIDDCILAVRNAVALQEYNEAHRIIDIMDEHWQFSEKTLLLKIEYYAAIKNSKEIKKILDVIDQNDIYLSSYAQEAIAFWID